MNCGVPVAVLVVIPIGIVVCQNIRSAEVVWIESILGWPMFFVLLCPNFGGGVLTTGYPPAVDHLVYPIVGCPLPLLCRPLCHPPNDPGCALCVPVG